MRTVVVFPAPFGPAALDLQVQMIHGNDLAATTGAELAGQALGYDHMLASIL